MVAVVSTTTLTTIFRGEGAEMRKPRHLTRTALAERVAEHGSVARAADDLGIHLGYARRLWTEIVKSFGAQAQ